MNNTKILILIIIIIILSTGIYFATNKTEEKENTSSVITEASEKNSEDEENEKHTEGEEHDHSVEIEGSDMKMLSIQEVANLWEIDAEILLKKMITEFELSGTYTIDTQLEDIRNAEYKFSPAMIKDFAETLKAGL